MILLDLLAVYSDSSTPSHISMHVCFRLKVHGHPNEAKTTTTPTATATSSPTAALLCVARYRPGEPASLDPHRLSYCHSLLLLFFLSSINHTAMAYCKRETKIFFFNWDLHLHAQEVIIFTHWFRDLIRLRVEFSVLLVYEDDWCVSRLFMRFS